MLKGFEEFQKVGKDGFDAAVKSFGEMNKGFEAILPRSLIIPRRRSRMASVPSNSSSAQSR